jgi:two-component system, NarL family, sensor histidine kinase DegS
VAQNLAGLRFKSALWQHRNDAAPADMYAALEEMQLVLANAIEDIRRAIFALRPLEMDDLGFLPAMTAWVSHFSLHNRLQVKLETAGQLDHLPAGYELPLFRVIQEGLHNVHRHARASQIIVRLDVRADGGVTMIIRDDGCGFVPSLVGSRQHAKQYGLKQMRERVLDLGGALEIRSVPGQGTTLCIGLPAVDQSSLAAGSDYATD